jgi:hypothetical protein
MTANQTGAEVFPHDEYHFYTVDHEDEPRHLHLTEDIVEDCRDLIDTDYPIDRADWNPKFWRHIEDGINFMFCPLDPDHSAFYYCSPFGDLGGGAERVFGSVFDQESVWIDSYFLCASTGPPTDVQDANYKEIREEVVLPEHREQYTQELIEHLEIGNLDSDWVEPCSA